jgi:chorismate synthase
MRVAVGGVARIVLNALVSGGVDLRGAMVQMGSDRIDPALWDDSQREANPFWCPDHAASARWETLLDGVRKRGSSVGGVVEVRASNVPVGLGAPVYDKLDADLAKAMMSINAVKGVEIGEGFGAAALFGEDNADQMVPGTNGGPNFLSNHAGGILGGITTGQDIVVRLAVKPTSSLLIPTKSVDRHGNAIEVITKGRHDPCVAIRAVPVAEAMLAIVLADHLLRHRGQCGGA